jgi:hypothetical protein
MAQCLSRSLLLRRSRGVTFLHTMEIRVTTLASAHSRWQGWVRRGLELVSLTRKGILLVVVYLNASLHCNYSLSFNSNILTEQVQVAATTTQPYIDTLHSQFVLTSQWLLLDTMKFQVSPGAFSSNSFSNFCIEQTLKSASSLRRVLSRS